LHPRYTKGIGPWSGRARGDPGRRRPGGPAARETRPCARAGCRDGGAGL